MDLPPVPLESAETGSAPTLERSLDDLRSYLETQFGQQAELIQELRQELKIRRVVVDGIPSPRGDGMASPRGDGGGPSLHYSVSSISASMSMEFNASEELEAEATGPANPIVTVIEDEREASLELVAEEKAQDMASSKTMAFGADILQRHLKAKDAEARKGGRRTLVEATSMSYQTIRRWTKIVVEAGWFSMLVLVLIVANAILLGAEIDVAFSLPEAEIPSWYALVNTLIVVFFVLEISAKFVAYGCHEFWRGEQAAWNIFDFVIVSLSAAETAMDLWAATLADSMWGSDALSVVRTMRLARALRGVRFFRLFRHFSALRALILSIVSTIGSLMWTLVLLAIIFYSFGVILMQLVTDYCRYIAIENTGDLNAVPDCPAELDRFWSSIGQSMLTLFFSITSGISWSDALNPLYDVSVLAVGTMLVYIVLSVFTILNVVTGVFVNTAIERASADKEIAQLKTLQKRAEQMESLQGIFQDIDQSNTNDLKVQDIEAAVNGEKLDAVLETLGISTEDMKTLFSLIDADGSGSIDLEEFVSGCMQLHGPARSVQLAKIGFENKRIASSIHTLMGQVRDMQKKIGTLMAFRGPHARALSRPMMVSEDDLHSMHSI